MLDRSDAHARCRTRTPLGVRGAMCCQLPQFLQRVLERSDAARDREHCRSSCSASQERAAKRFESAVQARFHGGMRKAEDAGHLFILQLFLIVKAEQYVMNGG